jgi:hypothetical protein
MAEQLHTVGDGEIAHASEDEVETLNEELDQGSAKTEDDDSDQDDERSTKVDNELNDAASEDEREAIRARRREERQRRKRNQHEKVDSLERTVSTLAEQNRLMAEQLSKLQNSDTSAKLAQLDSAIQEAAQMFERYKDIQADAIAKSDGATATQAMDLMLKARDRFTQLSSVKTSIVDNSRRPQVSQIDPEVRSAATRFQSKHNWYKGPQASDPDSKILTMLDNEVSAAGFNPKADDYWKELEARAKKYLPHRFNGSTSTENGDDYNSPNKSGRPRSPVAGSSTRGATSSETEGSFKLSAERVKAMKEAGIWDDPERRKKMINTYRNLDREQN